MRTQFGKRILDSDICVLCGERAATTKEHIPPKGLFEVKPAEYLSVPACLECNNSTKLEDEYLLQVMSAGSLVGKGREIWKVKVLPKLQEFPKTKYGLRDLLSIGKIRLNRSETLPAPLLSLDIERLNKSVMKLIYGLYWFHTEELLSQTAEIKIKFLNPVDGPKYFKTPEIQKLSKTMSMGVYEDPQVWKTFFYTLAIFENFVLFHFFFYKQNAFVATIIK